MGIEVAWMSLLDLFKRKKPSCQQYEAELEHITTCLINETKAKLRKQFQAELQNEIAKGNIIEAEYAIRTLEMLIKEAVASRKILIGRIEKDVETGELYDRYYGKMQTINSLTNKAYALMQRMDVAKERYMYEKEIYKKINDKMYVSDAIPDDISIKKTKKKRRDILVVMDESKKNIEEGGED